MFGQFSTCDLVEFQRLLWSGQTHQQPQYMNNQQPTIITGIQQQPAVIATNSNTVLVQTSNNNSMPVPRQQNFLNQSSVSFTTQPTTRYIPNQAQSRVSHSSPHNTILIQQQQPQTQTLFSQSQAIPLDLGKQAQEARIREMVPEFEEQYFIQTSPTKNSSGRGNNTAVHRPQPHVPTSQAISEHLSRSYPQQDLIQIHRQQELQQQSKQSKKSRQNEMYQSAMVELEVGDHADDDDYTGEEEEEEDDDSEEEYEEYEPAGDAGPWKCGVCLKVYKRKSNFLAHQKTHKKKIQCSMCYKEFASDKTYQRHLKTHHQYNTNTTLTPSKKSSKAQRQQLQAAISSISGGSVSGGQQQNQQQYYQQGQPPMIFFFKCDFCPEQFVTSDQLKAHEQMHLAESTLRCITCEKPFLREDEFNQHIKTHLTETIWKCNTCATKYDEYKTYKEHLDSHLPVVYKDPPPKPPEPEKTEESKNDHDDDIVEMACFEDEGSPQPSTSAAAKAKLNSPAKKATIADLAGGEWTPLPKRPPMKNFGSNKAKYATGSNMKVTAKASSGRDIIVRPTSTPTSSDKKYDADDDEIVVLSASETPHRPIPIRVPPMIRKISNATGLPRPPVTSKMNRPSATLNPRPKSTSNAKSKTNPPPAKQQKQRGRPKSMPTTLRILEDELFQFQCIICKAYFSTKPARQQHILVKHCSQKSIEIKLLKLEDDPELDLEVIEDEECM